MWFASSFCANAHAWLSLQRPTPNILIMSDRQAVNRYYVRKLWENVKWNNRVRIPGHVRLSMCVSVCVFVAVHLWACAVRREHFDHVVRVNCSKASGFVGDKKRKRRIAVPNKFTAAEIVATVAKNGEVPEAAQHISLRSKHRRRVQVCTPINTCNASMGKLT